MSNEEVAVEEIIKGIRVKCVMCRKKKKNRNRRNWINYQEIN